VNAEESLRAFQVQLDPTPSDEQIEALATFCDVVERTDGQDLPCPRDEMVPSDDAARAAHNWAIDNPDAADWALCRIGEAVEALAEVDGVFERQLRQLQNWRDREHDARQRTVAYFESKLADYHRELLDENPKNKTVHLPHGTLTARKAPDRVEIAEGMAPALPLEFQRVTITADKRGVLAHIKATGEILPGVTLISGELKFTAKPGGDA